MFGNVDLENEKYLKCSLCILRSSTKPVCWGFDQKLWEEVFRLAADRLREPNVFHQDQLKEDVMVPAKHQELNDDWWRWQLWWWWWTKGKNMPVVERKPPNHHLIHDHANPPPDHDQWSLIIILSVQLSLWIYISGNRYEPVDSSAIIIVLKHLGGQVFWRSTKCLPRRQNESRKISIFNKTLQGTCESAFTI